VALAMARTPSIDVQERVQSLPDGRSPAIHSPAPRDLAQTKRVDSMVRNNLTTGVQTPAKEKKTDDRTPFLTGFNTWFQAQMVELIKLKRKNKRSYAPPELIPVVCPLIEMVERPVESATKSESAMTEGSLYSDKDWNSRLGIPQYRTQSDNLASPEATCNVTSLAMALERLGYNRADILSSIEVELKKSHTQEQKKGSKITLDALRQEKIKAYLKAENKAKKGYQKLRGQTNTDQTMDGWAEDYAEKAQMEDLLDFLSHLKGVHRTTIVSDPSVILPAVESKSKLSYQRIDKIGDWQKFSDQIRTHLNSGGSANFSFRHKGKGDTKTHIISIQSMETDGFIVDDPYGHVRSNYSGNKVGDAFADQGKTRNRKNKLDSSDSLNDWEVDRAQSPEDYEQKGNSYLFSRASIESSFSYVMLFGRNPKPSTQPRS
jgi:uncharacterized protein YvpB